MARVITFGCRLNTYESQVIKELVKDEENIAVFNTCGVTKEASRQAKQAIRKYKRENPNIKVVVTGCDAQIDPQKYIDMEEVDQIIGNVDKFKAENYKKDDRQIVSDIMEIKEIAPHMATSFDGRVRAFIEIQNGCNHRCTFCTIPYGRGNSRSVPLQSIIKQIQVLQAQGFKEFVLTGVDITDYGLDLPGKPSLGQTIQRLFNILPDLERLRLSSLDPSEMDETLWELIQYETRLLPHLHLSLQSGDDLILKRMKRRHLRHHIFEFLERTRLYRPDITLGADIIAGFPTETDQMFENTKEICEQLDLLHIFPFSAHENTPASRMPQVPKNIIKERAKILQEVRKNAYQRLLSRWIGKADQILIEKVDSNIAEGKTDHFIPIQIKNQNYRIGDVINANIKGIDNGKLI